jgi:hypothetical protein
MTERQDQALEDFITAAAGTLGLPLDAAWMPAIKANVTTTLRLAAQVEQFPLPDEAEPAPVFEA